MVALRQSRAPSFSLDTAYTVICGRFGVSLSSMIRISIFFLLLSRLASGGVRSSPAASTTETVAIKSNPQNSSPSLSSSRSSILSSISSSSSTHNKILVDASIDFGDSTNSNSRRRMQQFQQYTLWEPRDIPANLLKWQSHYSDLIRVTTSQEEYGLGRAGGEQDCPFDTGGNGCLNYFFVMQDFVAHPEGSDSSNRLPEILWSGELHGDERVGPTAVLEASQLLMDAAMCESLPRVALKGTDTEAWEKELKMAQECRDDLHDRFGISDDDRQWLARLITTRRIVVVPTANALGYFQVRRTEGFVDPNRDFPYDLEDPTACMQTIAARTLNEIYREHMFQLAFTFHGGMEVIGYEWGAPSWQNFRSPDDTAQHQIAEAYSHYGGGWKDSDPYQFGDMNSMVYPVNGGMEDWAYAASWDSKHVVQCQPDTFGGYAADKTTYGPSTLRVFNMLVESSDNKIPPTEMLGTSQDLLRHDSVGTGYVSRNIRLSFLSAELVEPYVVIRGVNELLLSNDLVPLVDRSGRSCQSTRTVSVPVDSRKVVLQWVVGGSLSVDNTQLWYAKWSDIPTDKLDCLSQPSMEDIQKFMKAATPISETKGSSRFQPGSSYDTFSASFDISSSSASGGTSFAVGDKLVVLASAKVDQNWMQDKVDKVQPDLKPQSHVVNVRTDPTWHHESAGKIIQGRLDWFSAPLTIVLRNDNKNGEPVAIELSDRFAESSSVTTSSVSTTTSGEPGTEKVGKSLGAMVAIALVVIISLVIGSTWLRHRFRLAQRSRVREFIEDENAPSPGLRHKRTMRSTSNGGGYSTVENGDRAEVELSEFA